MNTSDICCGQLDKPIPGASGMCTYISLQKTALVYKWLLLLSVKVAKLVKPARLHLALYSNPPALLSCHLFQTFHLTQTTRDYPTPRNALSVRLFVGHVFYPI